MNCHTGHGFVGVGGTGTAGAAGAELAADGGNWLINPNGIG